MSDLHLEARKTFPFIPANALILILAGDIGSWRKSTLRAFLADVSRRFQWVFYVPGNHEYFGSTFEETDNELSELVRSFPNVILLQNASYALDIDGRKFTIIGTTLWAPCPPDVQIRDFRRIWVNDGRRFTPQRMTSAYNSAVAALVFLMHRAHVRGREVVIITHHAPFLEANGPYMNHPASGSYASDLLHLLLDSARLWVYGHTHLNMSKKAGACIVCTNAFGYPGERIEHFQRSAVVAL